MNDNSKQKGKLNLNANFQSNSLLKPFKSYSSKSKFESKTASIPIEKKEDTEKQQNSKKKEYAKISQKKLQKESSKEEKEIQDNSKTVIKSIINECNFENTKETNQVFELLSKLDSSEKSNLSQIFSKLSVNQSKELVKNLQQKFDQPSEKLQEIITHFESKNIQVIPFTKLTNQGQLLGEGGFGVVYKGKWNDSIDIAIKEITLQLSEFKKIDKEIALMAIYRHPRIITLYGICLQESFGKLNCQLILELMTMDLEAYIYTSTVQKNLKDKVKILIHILEGIAFLHSQDLVHCDIKPKNVLLDDSFNSKLTDLGISKVLSNQNKPESTTLAFTTRYASKSVILEERFSFKSDMWSFGLMMYELLKERKPFNNLNQIQILLALQQEKNPFEIEWDQGVSEPLVNIIKICASYDESKIPTAQYCLEIIKKFNQI